MGKRTAAGLRPAKPAVFLAAAAGVAGLFALVAGCNVAAPPAPAGQQAQTSQPPQTTPGAPAAPGAAAPALPLTPAAQQAQAQQAAPAPASTAPADASSTDPSEPHYVAPPTADELQRKRAEWEEQQRQAEQTQAEMQEWRRSRRTTEIPKVRVGAAAPAGPSESDQMAVAMRDWYSRYSVRAAAVSLALSQFGMSSDTYVTDPRRRQAACRDLRGASQVLLADPRLLQAPLDSVATSLTTAYTEIKGVADSCLAFRDADIAAHMAAARRAMTQAASALRPYHMTP